MPIRLDSLVRERFQLSWGKARSRIETGKVFVNGSAVMDPGTPVDAAAAIELRMNAPRPSKRGADSGARAGDPAATAPGTAFPRIIFKDTQIAVVDKPAGMSTVPYSGEARGRPPARAPGISDETTLQDWLADRLGRPRVEVVHRLDRETSGLLVFALNPAAARALAQQFRFHTVARRYLAIAHGAVEAGVIRSLLVENRGDGLRGSRRPGSPARKDEAKEAVTHVTPLARLESGDGIPMTLIECRLETGRTHQIRIHLSEAGHPLAGERAYVREHAGPRATVPRIMLHAFELGFAHPVHGAQARWTAAPPADFLAFLPERARALLPPEAR